jgi:hypothetical protein
VTPSGRGPSDGEPEEERVAIFGESVYVIRSEESEETDMDDIDPVVPVVELGVDRTDWEEPEEELTLLVAGEKAAFESVLATREAGVLAGNIGK